MTPPVEPEKTTNSESESEWGDVTSHAWLRDYIMHFSENKAKYRFTLNNTEIIWYIKQLYKLNASNMLKLYYALKNEKNMLETDQSIIFILIYWYVFWAC